MSQEKIYLYLKNIKFKLFYNLGFHEFHTDTKHMYFLYMQRIKDKKYLTMHIQSIEFLTCNLVI